MARFPYRVKSLRTLESSSGEERSYWIEKEHRVCIWRVSETEFQIEKVVLDTDQALVSSRAKAGHLCCVFTSQVRDCAMYSVGEAMPWPDHVSPPAVVDSEDAMLRTLDAGPVKPAGAAGGKAKGAAA